MAKRYHQSKKARMSEHMGMERYERGPVRGSMSHAKDKFNDEHHNDKEGDRSGAYKASNIDEGYYIGMEPRRRQEMEDAGMIHEDHRAIANLPQEVMIKPYPRTGPYLPEGIDDTIRNIDAEMDFDDSKRKEHFFPKKV